MLSFLQALALLSPASTSSSLHARTFSEADSLRPSTLPQNVVTKAAFLVQETNRGKPASVTTLELHDQDQPKRPRVQLTKRKKTHPCTSSQPLAATTTEEDCPRLDQHMAPATHSQLPLGSEPDSNTGGDPSLQRHPAAFEPAGSGPDLAMEDVGMDGSEGDSIAVVPPSDDEAEQVRGHSVNC